MDDCSDPHLSQEMERVKTSAQRLGIELDECEALRWVNAIAAAALSSPQERMADITIDTRTGIFGHKVVMLDFSPEQLDYFREIGRLVEFEDQPGVVETALALSGSSAQSKIQTYPGDADYFERINILAPTREKACQILGELVREKALSRERGATYQLIEVKFGAYPHTLHRRGRAYPAGAPISWLPDEIRLGQLEGQLEDGTAAAIRWEDAARDPGWCKLDWVIADPLRGALSNASNMLDVTWEAPDGSITPLDGYLDPYFQEVYLEAASVPIFSKLAQHVSADALEQYVTQLEKEVRKYLRASPANYGKAAKRMYNIFRLTARYLEAAFVRELFDEPATMLYQVGALIRTIDDCCRPDSSISMENVLAQTDSLVLAVVSALEGDEETEIVRLLLRLRSALTRQEEHQELNREAEAARAEVVNAVNNFFYEKLTGYPDIKAYMDALHEG